MLSLKPNQTTHASLFNRRFPPDPCKDAADFRFNPLTVALKAWGWSEPAEVDVPFLDLFESSSGNASDHPCVGRVVFTIHHPLALVLLLPVPPPRAFLRDEPGAFFLINRGTVGSRENFFVCTQRVSLPVTRVSTLEYRQTGREE